MELILKLLDWPFLLFVGLGIILVKFKPEVQKLLARGGITLTWGDKSFAISDLPEQLNETFATVTDDIQDLKARVEQLEKQLFTAQGHTSREEQNELTAKQIETARERMLKGLEEGKFTWRSIERLATIGNITEMQASNILRSMSEVTFGRGKSGRTIVKLSSK